MTAAGYRGQVQGLRASFENGVRAIFGSEIHATYIIDHDDSCDVYVFFKRNEQLAKMGEEQVMETARKIMSNASIKVYGYDGVVPCVRIHVDTDEQVQKACGGNYYMYMT